VHGGVGYRRAVQGYFRFADYCYFPVKDQRGFAERGGYSGVVLRHGRHQYRHFGGFVGRIVTVVATSCKEEAQQNDQWRK
jgi:hypothetical protein